MVTHGSVGRHSRLKLGLRQFLPKGAEIFVASQEYLNHVAWLMNTRPRQTLGGRRRQRSWMLKYRPSNYVLRLQVGTAPPSGTEYHRSLEFHMNSRWQDDFDPDAYDDHKMASVEWERLRQEHSVHCWIYIGTDIRHNDMAKIGLTAGELGTRASSSQNPYFTLLCAFKVKDGTSAFHLAEIERSVKAMLASEYEEIPHYGSQRASEWFRLSPEDMRELVHWFLYDRFSQYMDCYYCWDRDMVIIRGWENTRLIHGGVNQRYGTRDVSNPPISFECLTPPGCGEDCDCW